MPFCAKVFFLRALAAEVRDEDQVCCIFNIQTMIQDKPVRAVVHRYLGFSMDFLMFHVLQKNLILITIHGLVQHHQNISDPLPDQLQVSSFVHNKNTKLIARTTAPQWCCQKLHFSTIFKRKCALNKKVSFLLKTT